jgi:hypothetical protein
MLVAACASFGDTDSKPPPVVDGGMPDGGPVPVPPANAIYVSAPAGNDANDGRSKDKPLKTIAAAFALVETSKLDNFDVVVCGGLYAEPAVTSRKASALRGGYNCNTWTRADDFGKAGQFKGPNQTRLIGNTSFDALSVTIPTTFTLEGIDVESRAGGNKAAVRVDGPGKLVVSNARVYGGGSDGQMVVGTTYALDVRASEVAIRDSEFHGGAGNNSTLSVEMQARGSVALQLIDSWGDIGNSILDAGTGRGGHASVGAILASSKAIAGPLLVHDSAILGSVTEALTSDTSTTPWAFFGMLATVEGKVTLDNVRIMGAEVKATGGARTSGVLGLYHGGKGQMEVLNSRINPGQISGTVPWAYCQTVSSSMEVTASLTFINSALYADCGNAAGVANTGNVAYQVSGGTTVLQHNTIIAIGRPGNPPENNSAVFGYDNAVLRAENNFLVAGNGSAVVLYQCANARFESFRANALFSAAGFTVRTANDGSCVNATWVDTALASIERNASAVILPSLADRFEPAALSMFATALKNGAIRPSSSRAGCEVSRGGADLLANVPNDIEGKPRTAKPAIGAWEASAPDCP